MDIRISVEGSADQSKELLGIAGWLNDEESFTRYWTFTALPAPGRAGALEDLVVALSAHLAGTALADPVRALVSALTGWLRSRVRLSQGSRTVVKVQVPGRSAVRITESELTGENVPDLIDRIRAELEAGTTGGA
ncbi:hypothetical protein ABZW18_24330 [Streptomyces sp. NPDC004647]|uniref:effector-associated constant component EACC1 n=1 Tax=Streptomyces sp. NPDC004647 TaxID=3154671 RepID=UPI0033B3D64E